MKAEPIIDLVMELVGNITPVGETHTDSDRLENLKKLINITNSLLINISEVGFSYKESELYSMKEASTVANNFLKNCIGIAEHED